VGFGPLHSHKTTGFYASQLRMGLWVHSATALGRPVRPVSPGYSWSFITMNGSCSLLARYKGGQTLITPLSLSSTIQNHPPGAAHKLEEPAGPRLWLGGGGRWGPAACVRRGKTRPRPRQGRGGSGAAPPHTPVSTPGRQRGRARWRRAPGAPLLGGRELSPAGRGARARAHAAAGPVAVSRAAPGSGVVVSVSVWPHGVRSSGPASRPRGWSAGPVLRQLAYTGLPA
jgi:hypothetical protein